MRIGFGYPKCDDHIIKNVKRAAERMGYDTFWLSDLVEFDKGFDFAFLMQSVDSTRRIFSHPTVFWKTNRGDCVHFIDEKGGHINPVDMASSVDLFLSAFKTDLNQFPGKVKNIDWMSFGADPTIYKPYSDEPQLYDVVFAGSTIKPKETRKYLLDYLKSNGIIVSVHNSPPKPKLLFEDLARFYNKGSIIFNFCEVRGFNTRVFEAMACGKLLVTNWIIDEDNWEEPEHYFKNGEHLILYDTKESLLDIVEYYLEHKKEREYIAMNGLKEIRAKHTWEHRVDFIVKKVEELIL